MPIDISIMPNIPIFDILNLFTLNSSNKIISNATNALKKAGLGHIFIM